MVCGSGIASLRRPRRLFVLCVLAAGEPGGGGICALVSADAPSEGVVEVQSGGGLAVCVGWLAGCG